MTGTSHQISVTVSPELLAALDQVAFERDETRAGTVRRILVDELRDIGRLALAAAPTVQLGMHNARYSAGRRS